MFAPTFLSEETFYRKKQVHMLHEFRMTK